jgi:hypothetical protein
MRKAVWAGALLLGSGAWLVAHGATTPASLPAAKPALKSVAPTDKSFTPTCKAGPVAEAPPEPAWISASFANDHCAAPPLPVAVNGYVAKRTGIVAAMAAHKKYDLLAGAYQRCIRDFEGARQAQAQKTGQRVNVALLLIENHRIAASRASMQTVAQRTDLAVNQFNEYGSSCPD